MVGTPRASNSGVTAMQLSVIPGPMITSAPASANRTHASQTAWAVPWGRPRPLCTISSMGRSTSPVSIASSNRKRMTSPRVPTNSSPAPRPSLRKPTLNGSTPAAMCRPPGRVLLQFSPTRPGSQPGSVAGTDVTWIPELADGDTVFERVVELRPHYAAALQAVDDALWTQDVVDPITLELCRLRIAQLLASPDEQAAAHARCGGSGTRRGRWSPTCGTGRRRIGSTPACERASDTRNKS